jgi:hypothetical protein
MATVPDSMQHEPACTDAGISHLVFLLIPIVTISFVAVLCSRACGMTFGSSPKDY